MPTAASAAASAQPAARPRRRATAAAPISSSSGSSSAAGGPNRVSSRSAIQAPGAPSQLLHRAGRGGVERRVARLIAGQRDQRSAIARATSAEPPSRARRARRAAPFAAPPRHCAIRCPGRRRAAAVAMPVPQMFRTSLHAPARDSPVKRLALQRCIARADKMERADVIILGGGLVGLTLAVALDRARPVQHRRRSRRSEPAARAGLRRPRHGDRQRVLADAARRSASASGSTAKAARSARIRVSDGLEPGGSSSIPAPTAATTPLGMMFENRLLRSALREAAPRRPSVDMLMPARAAEVVRDEAGVRVALERRPRRHRAAADRRGGPQFADARGGAASRGALELRSCRDRRHRRARAAARECRLRDFLSRRPVRDPADAADEDGRPARRSSGRSRSRTPRRCSELPRRAFAAEVEKRMGGFLGAVELAGPRCELSARLPPCRARSPPSGWRWSATPRTASTRSPARGSTSASATSPRWPRCWSRARGSASISAMRSCSPATSAGAASTPSWSPPPPTA